MGVGAGEPIALQSVLGSDTGPNDAPVRNGVGAVSNLAAGHRDVQDERFNVLDAHIGSRRGRCKYWRHVSAVRRHRLYDFCQRKVHAFCNRTYTTRNGHRENKLVQHPFCNFPEH